METPTNCPEDCELPPQGPECGDSICQTGEDCSVDCDGVTLFYDDFISGINYDEWNYCGQCDPREAISWVSDERTAIKLIGHVEHRVFHETFPAYISTQKRFLTDNLQLSFFFKTNELGFNVELQQNFFGAYRVGISAEHLSLSKDAWNHSDPLGHEDISLDLTQWHQLVVKNNAGEIQIFLDDVLVLSYTDLQPLGPGGIAFSTTTPDSEVTIDNVLVKDVDPDFQTSYTLAVDAATNVGPFVRTYPCATLWTEDDGTIPFATDGPTADLLMDVDLEYMRIRAVGDEGWLGGGVLVTKNPDGTLNIDFTNLDETIDRIYAMGKKPYMRLGWGMPEDMADPECSATNNYAVCPPEDYADWEELVYQIVNRYNNQKGYDIEHWVVWNEPDGHEYGGDQTALANIDKYLELYHASVDGALRADPSIKIGGPTIAGSCGDGPIVGESCFWTEPGMENLGKMFTEGLLEYCADNDVRLDLLVFHRYGFIHPRYYYDLITEMDELAASYGLDPELILDEWSLWTRPQKEETSAYAVSSIHYQTLAGLDLSCYTSFNAFSSETLPAPYYPEAFGLAMIDGRLVKTPYFAFKMLSMLGDEKLETEFGNGEITEDHSMGALTTRDSTGVQLLIWRYDQTPQVEKEILFAVKGLEETYSSTSYTVTSYLIDETENNPYYYYVTQGNFDPMLNLEIANLEVDMQETISLTGGELEFSADLKGYSVFLVMIEPQ